MDGLEHPAIRIKMSELVVQPAGDSPIRFRPLAARHDRSIPRQRTRMCTPPCMLRRRNQGPPGAVQKGDQLVRQGGDGSNNVYAKQGAPHSPLTPRASILSSPPS